MNFRRLKFLYKLIKRYQYSVGMTTSINLLILLAGCTSLKTSSALFEDLVGCDNVVIYLNKYKLDSVPVEIGMLKNVRSLRIAKDSTSGWTVFPPASAFKEITKKPPFRQLPDAIASLTTLQNLDLSGLDLKSLPDDFDKLQNLDSLNLMLNKLVIANEIDKLRKLKRLKYLAIFGNDVDTSDVLELRKHNPSLIIVSGLEQSGEMEDDK